MARPTLYDEKLVTKQITVHPREWEAFAELMQQKGTSSSARIRAYVRWELRRAKAKARKNAQA